VRCASCSYYSFGTPLGLATQRFDAPTEFFRGLTCADCFGSCLSELGVHERLLGQATSLIVLFLFHRLPSAVNCSLAVCNCREAYCGALPLFASCTARSACERAAVGGLPALQPLIPTTVQTSTPLTHCNNRLCITAIGFPLPVAVSHTPCQSEDSAASTNSKPQASQANQTACVRKSADAPISSIPGRLGRSTGCTTTEYLLF
jgi:hypothetical protein